MDRWENCPASIRLSDGLPDVDPGPAAKEGTRVHELCERILKGESYHTVVANESLEVKLNVHLYVDTIGKDMKAARDAAKKAKSCLEPELFVEKQWGIPDIHPDAGGTTDAAIYDHEERKLLVYDYKNGKTDVPIEGNPQLMTYALAAMMNLPFCVETVELVIVQPNTKGKKQVKRWAFPSGELVDFAARVREAARRTEEHDLPPVMGRWCFWCPAKHKCPAQVESSYEKAAAAFAED